MWVFGRYFLLVSLFITMKVIQAIRKLLFLEDCVIIPGLGGFVSQYRPAVIDKSTGTFSPPAKVIVFNGELVQNDGILVDFIAAREGIPTGMARQQVDLFVEETRKKLEHGIPVFIEGIGQFFQDSNREIRFQADAGTNLFLDSFGLAPFHLHEVAQDKDSGLKNALIFSRDESPRTVEFSVTVKRKSSSHHNLRRIAIAMPLLIAFSLLPYNSRVTDNLSSSRASMIPEPSLYRLNYPDTQKRDTAKVIVFPISERVTSETVTSDAVTSDAVTSDRVTGEERKAEEVKPVKVSPSVGQFPVIAGCFKIKSNAERLHKQLSDKGYPAAIIPMRNGMFKVRMQSFATRQEAIEGLARIKKAEPGMQLWAAL